MTSTISQVVVVGVVWLPVRLVCCVSGLGSAPSEGCTSLFFSPFLLLPVFLLALLLAGHLLAGFLVGAALPRGLVLAVDREGVGVGSDGGGGGDGDGEGVVSLCSNCRMHHSTTTLQLAVCH